MGLGLFFLGGGGGGRFYLGWCGGNCLGGGYFWVMLRLLPKPWDPVFNLHDFHWFSSVFFAGPKLWLYRENENEAT